MDREDWQGGTELDTTEASQHTHMHACSDKLLKKCNVPQFTSFFFIYYFFFKLQTSGTITALRDHLHHYTDGTYFSQYFIKIVYLTTVNQEY